MTTPLPPDAGNPQQTTAVPTATSVNFPATTTNQPVLTTSVPTQYFTAEQLEAARQQEKDKLYGRLQELEQKFTAREAELTRYRTEREEAETARQKAVQDAEAAKKAEEESKLSVQELIAKKESEWQQQLTEQRGQLETQRALMEQEQRLFVLQQYIQRRVNEELNAGNLMEELVEFIDGSTEEEVEASIKKAVEKTAKIFEGAQRLNSGAPQQPSTYGVSPTGFAPTGPLDNLSGTQQYTPEDIRNMSPKEYAEFRVKAGIANAGNNRGLF